MENQKVQSREKLIKLVVAAMFTALVFLGTRFIAIPAPVFGYLNIGDCFILIAAWILGPVYGFAAGAVGSALGDLAWGAFLYIPGTFVIKGLMAVAASLIAHAFVKKNEKLRIPAFVVSGIVVELIMAFGYFLYEGVILFGTGLYTDETVESVGSFAAAWLNMPMNLTQGAIGLGLGLALAIIFAQTRLLKKVHYDYSYAI